MPNRFDRIGAALFLSLTGALTSRADLLFPRERYYAGEEIRGDWTGESTPPATIDIVCFGKTLERVSVADHKVRFRAPDHIKSPALFHFRSMGKDWVGQVQIFPRDPGYYWPQPGLQQKQIALWDPDDTAKGLFQFLGLSPTRLANGDQIRMSPADLLVAVNRNNWPEDIDAAVFARIHSRRPVYVINTATETWKNVGALPPEIRRPIRWGSSRETLEGSRELNLIETWTEEPLAPWVFARFLEKSLQRNFKKETSNKQSEVTP